VEEDDVEKEKREVLFVYVIFKLENHLFLNIYLIYKVFNKTYRKYSALI
jgi:hypothetical protein